MRSLIKLNNQLKCSCSRRMTDTSEDKRYTLDVMSQGVIQTGSLLLWSQRSREGPQTQTNEALYDATL